MIFQDHSSHQQNQNNARPAPQAAQAYTWQQTNSLMMNRWREKNSHSPNRRNGNGRNGQNGRNGRQNFPKDETFATNPADLEEDFNFEASNQLFDKQQVYGEMNMNGSEDHR
jgi:hypothetical protein